MRRLASVSIGSIERIRADVVVGVVEFRFNETIGAVEFGHIVSAKMRISHSAASTLEALEAKLLQAAQGLLIHAGQLSRQEIDECARRLLPPA